MAGSSFFPVPLDAAALQPPSCWAGPQPPEAREGSWGWPLGQSSCSNSGSSPASSPDSCGGFSPAEHPWRPDGSGRSKSGRPRLGHGQRRSASQREKLRMRHLAQALHALRRYLPAAGMPAGHNLTKIETLRLAIRYIAHLSGLLGLSEEELLARRGAARDRPRCPLCPPGLGCCQAGAPKLPARAPWPSQGEPASFPGAAPSFSGSASSQPPGSPPPASSSSSWDRWAPGSSSCIAVGTTKQTPPAWETAGTRAEMLPAEEWPPAHPQNLPEELLSFLEGFVPLALQDCLSSAHPLPAVLTSGLDPRNECL